jgi:hypothetical protein
MKKFAISGLLSMAMMAPAVSAASPFVDIDPSHWAYKQIKSLYDAGIIRGDGTGKFKGNERISRYEAAALVYQAINYVNRTKSAGGSIDAEMMDTINSLMTELTDEMQVIEVRIEENSDAIAQLRNHVATMSGKPNTGATMNVGSSRLKIFGQAMFSLVSGGDDSGYIDTAAALAPGAAGNQGGVMEFTNDYAALGLAADIDEKTSFYARANVHMGGHANPAGLANFTFNDYMYVYVKDMWSDWDMSLGRIATPWGHETAGMFRTNPYFISNSFLNSQVVGLVQGAYFSTESEDGEWNWGIGIHNGDLMNPDNNYTHLNPFAPIVNRFGTLAWAQAGVGGVNNNSDDSLGYILHVGSKAEDGDFKWDVNYFTNSGDRNDANNASDELNFFTVGLDYRINEDWHTSLEYVDGTLTDSTVANQTLDEADFTTWYLQVVYNLDEKSTLALRYDKYEADAENGVANPIMEMDGITFAYARKVSDNGTLLVEWSQPDYDKPVKPAANKRDDYDVIRASYRIDF